MSDKNVPEVRFKGFCGGWESKLFSEVFDTTIPNNTLSRANLNYENGEVKNIHYGDILIKFGEITNVKKANIPFVTDFDMAKYKSHFLANGDVIFADTAEDETVGKATEITGIGKEKVVSGLHTIPVRPRNLKPVGYLGYYINSNSYQQQLLDLMQGIKVLSISKRNLANTSVSYPLLDDEQTKIGEFFKNLDNLIAKNQKKYDKLLNMKKACLDQMFPKDRADTPELRFKGFVGGWVNDTLGEITDVYDGTHQTPKYTESGIMFLSVENIKTLHSEKYISKNDFINDFKVFPQKNDVLMTRIGDIGTANVVDNDIQKAYYVSLALLKHKKLNPYFLKESIHSQNVKREIWHRTLHIAFPKKINKNEIEKVNVLFPNEIDEQTKIGTFFQNLDTLITLRKTELEKLKNIKKACLDKMFI